MYRSPEHVNEPVSTIPRDEQLHYQATILDNIQDVLITTDLQFRIRSWNRVAQHVYGYAEADAIGQDLSALIHLDPVRDGHEDALLQLQNTGSWKGEVAYTNKQGEVRYFLNTIAYLLDESGSRMGVLLIGKDVTERRIAQDQLRQSEKFYRSLIADSLDGIILTDTTGHIIFASPSVRQILGYEPAEVTGSLTFDFVHPDDRHLAYQTFERETTDSSEVKYIVVRLLQKSGDWLWCMLRAHNLLGNPYVNGIAVYFHDDTPRRIATEALKESEQRFRNLVADLRNGILLQDTEGRVLLSNNVMHEMMGTTEEKLLGKKIWEIYPDAVDENEEPLPLDQRPVYKAMAERIMVRDQVMGVRHPLTGQRIWMLLNADPILNSSGEVQSIICSFMDITERKKLEANLISNKLQHQRQLTQASIDSQERERQEIGKELHDNIGQQLTTIKLFLDLAKSTADDATAEMIALSVRNVSDVINEIRGLCRNLVPSTLGDLGLIESISDLVNTLVRTQRVQINVSSELFDEEKVAQNQMLMLFRIIQEQLNNIVKHAGATEIDICLKNGDGTLLLEVTDNGAGFDLKTVKRGLGLSNMRNRAETLGGSMDIVTRPGEGCTVRVTIPETGMSA
ncbi:MAG: domain S-box protein [Flaviaesturariibacter sp.]|nr:domain S-box protein [Flaviaesturariibacter sp.]